MRKVSLLLAFLLCTPFLFAGDIDSIFKKWQKEYAQNAGVVWNTQTASAEDNALLRQQSGIADIEIKQGVTIGYKVKDVWTKAYVVAVNKDLVGGAMIEGKLIDAAYKQHVEEGLKMIDQMFTIMSTVGMN